MVAVVIDRAKAGENEGASFKSPGEFGRAKEFRNREALALDEYGIDPGKVWKAKVPPVARKNYRAGVRVQGTCFRVEPANKKLVETCEGIRRVGEFGRIEAEIPDKRAHEGPAGGTSHPAAIPPGKKGSLDQVPQEGADRVFVGEAQPAFPVNLFGFEGLCQAVEIADWLHGVTLPLASRARQD